MNTHEPTEVLSAYLDGEVTGSERARIESHLRTCEECSSRKEALQGVMNAVASLPEIIPTPDEARTIRLAVIGRLSKFPRFWRMWVAAAGVAAVLVGISSVTVLTRGPGEIQTTAGSAEDMGSIESETLVFASPEEVRSAALSLPEVQEGAGRYRVADVGAEQSEAVGAVSGEDRVAGGAALRARGASEAEESAAVEVPLQECLSTILQSQPYPMMPVAARAAIFKGAPAWLLVYAWTNSTDENARLDRIQVWVVGRSNCSADAPLYVAFRL